MSKTLISLSLASIFALSSGCILVTGNSSSDTASDSATTTATESTSGTGTGTDTDTTGTGTGTEGTSDSEGTGSDAGTDSTTVAETTTATDSTTDSTTDSATDSDSASATDTDPGTGTDGTGGALPCGWHPVDNYYACEGAGGEAGVEDPMMLEPYACPDQPLEQGGDCGTISNLGCCDANGDLWYCAEKELLGEMCS